MLSKKRLIPLAIVLVFMLSIIGCSQQQAQQTPAPPAAEQNKDVILATTTSTQDSGLLDVLIPDFEKQSGYKVKTVAVGTGAALTMGQKGEADVLLTHAPSQEKPLVESGAITNYQLVMHNDFIIVGPEKDPAGIKGAKSAAEAFKKINEKGALFISRGDNSGTHTMEKNLWKAAGITPVVSDKYQESGQGMGQTLTIAQQKDGYTLTDRATYLAQKKNLTLAILVEGEKSLLNIYHVAQVNPEKFPKVNAAGAKAFVEFMVSPATQKTIAEFKVQEFGQPLFYADAGKNEADLGK
jgi:tungstate transport system substrate-binding protein